MCAHEEQCCEQPLIPDNPYIDEPRRTFTGWVAEFYDGILYLPTCRQ